MNLKNSQVSARIAESTKWQQELELLREIALDCGLKEELKWEEACYSLDEANVILLHWFKEYCAILFFKGVLMKDPEHILIQQTENVQSGRQIRFTTTEQVIRMSPQIKEYIAEAIAVEKSGEKVAYKQMQDYEIPDELQEAFASDPAFRNAFESLTPGRQRGYILYFSAAKQSKTRESRIEKSKDLIFDGFGLQDEYTQSKK